MQEISYYTMGDVMGTAEFARGRKRGSRDKKPRRRRRMIGGLAAGAGVLGAAGRYGLAGAREMRSSGVGRPAGLRAGMRGASTQMGTDLAAVKMGATKGARGINARSRNAVGTINNSARSVGRLLVSTKGGPTLAGAGAIAAVAAGGIYAAARRSRRRR